MLEPRGSKSTPYRGLAWLAMQVTWVTGDPLMLLTWLSADCKVEDGIVTCEHHYLLQDIEWRRSLTLLLGNVAIIQKPLG